MKKLSELKIGNRVVLHNICPKYSLDYKFKGEVKKCSEKSGETLWVENDNRGYIIDKKYDFLWEIEFLNKNTNYV